MLICMCQEQDTAHVFTRNRKWYMYCFNKETKWGIKKTKTVKVLISTFTRDAFIYSAVSQALNCKHLGFMEP